MAKSTIVIPNYNGINYIQACLESLYCGTTKDIRVIVVDNASTDGSMELVRDKFPQVQLIVNQKNTGFSHAVNQGIKQSATPYVILLNNDTQADISFVHELEKVMDDDKDRRIFSASAKLVSLYDRNATDDAGDFYCALGWAFARGRGRRLTGIAGTVTYLHPARGLQFTAGNCWKKTRWDCLTRNISRILRTLISDTAQKYMDIETDLRQTL